MVGVSKSKRLVLLGCGCVSASIYPSVARAAQQQAPPPAAPTPTPQQGPPTTEQSTPAEQAKPPADIIVTGSRIERPDLTSSSPVAVLSPQQLKQNNAVTVEELLNANPQFVPGQASSSNNPA